MKKLTTPLLAIAAATALIAAPSHAAPIGVNFVGGGGTLAPSDVAGHPDVEQSNWNNLTGSTGTSVAITDEDGNDNGGTLTITYSAPSVFQTGIGTATADQRLMNGYLDSRPANGNPATVTVTGVPFDVYQIYFYSDGDNTSDRQNGLILNEGTPSEQTVLLTDSGDGDVDFAGDYEGNSGQIATTSTPPTLETFTGRFDNVTGSSFTLETTGAGNRGPLQGFQIVVIPEPASLALLGLGGLCLLTRRKRA